MNTNHITYICIIATSARMLAQAAYREGFQVLVIDLYGDDDTCQYAVAWQRIASLTSQAVLPALATLLSQYPVSHVFYGSGFEAHSECLFLLEQHRQICGNTAMTFTDINHKPTFFNRLAALQIPFPITLFATPATLTNWLIKPLYGHGGNEIAYWHSAIKATDSYWQQYQQGIPHSVLFLANGADVQIIGFNRQWPLGNGGQEFLFSGVINQTELTPQHQSTISGWLTKLVPIFMLKGLNSLDFIQQDEHLWVLEINPRPSASMQLYDGDLLTWHINACAGLLPTSDMPISTVIKAYQIVYAPCDIQIPETIQWPINCMDLPARGSICRKGQPICSLFVRDKTAQNVVEQLQYLHGYILRQLGVD